MSSATQTPTATPAGRRRSARTTPRTTAAQRRELRVAAAIQASWLLDLPRAARAAAGRAAAAPAPCGA